MTKERIEDLDKLATGAIAECLGYGQSENLAFEFWKGVKMVVDELTLDVKGRARSNPPPTYPVRQVNSI